MEVLGRVRGRVRGWLRESKLEVDEKGVGSSV